MTKENIAQWVIDNRYSKSEFDKLSDSEMYYTLIDKIEQAINYKRCSTELKDKEAQDFYKWLKDNKYTRANSLIWQKNNEYYGEIGLFKIFKKKY